MSRSISTNLTSQTRLTGKKRNALEIIEEDDDSMEMEDTPVKDARCRASTIGYESPYPKRDDKEQAHDTCDTYKQLNKYYSIFGKTADQIDSEIYFDNTLMRLARFRHINFLDKHHIHEKFRAKMIDWTIEVLNTFKQKEATIYRSMFLLDYYYSCSHKKEVVEDLHLTGIACMMIASKSEEINFIKVDAFLNTVGKKKFTKEDLMSREMEVLSAVNFKTCGPTIFELLTCCFQVLDIKNAELKQFFEKCTLVLTKMCLFSYQLMNCISTIEIALYCLVLSLKMSEKVKQFDSISQVN